MDLQVWQERALVRPLCRFAVPAMVAQLGDKVAGKQAFVAVAYVGGDVLGLAHADNGRFDHWMGEHDANRHLGRGHGGGKELLEALHWREYSGSCICRFWFAQWRMRRRCLFASHSRRNSLLLIAVLVAGAAQICWAHAILRESTPKANTTVQGPDFAVNLRFNVRIDGSRSRLHLVAANGSSTQLNVAGQATPDTLQSQAKGLKPGAYKLLWNVLASDGHMSKGEIPFTVH